MIARLWKKSGNARSRNLLSRDRDQLTIQNSPIERPVTQPQRHHTEATATVYRGRFAPSPTGPLHFGSLVAALSSYLQAQTHNGHWTIRIDDIDPPREVDGATQAILSSLEVHGFPTNQVIYQRQQAEHYEKALDRLGTADRLYACACSRSFLRRTRPSPTAEQPAHTSPYITQNNDPGPVYPDATYPGNCRDLILPHQDNALRFRVSGRVSFTDLIQGPVEQDLVKEVGDFVIKRKDGLYAYQLATVVDDELDGITEVARGCDLLDNTPRQIALGNALGFSQPAYLHVPIAVNDSGQKLSKQTGAAALQSSEVINNLLRVWQFLGQAQVFDSTKYNNTSQGIREFWNTAKQHWSIERIPRVSTLTAGEIQP